jgi:hypothetical protein
MLHLRYSFAAGIVLMMVPVAQAQTAAPAKAAAPQGATSDGATSKKVAAKAQFAAAAAKTAAVQEQPIPIPAQNYSDGAPLVKKTVPPWRLSQVPADWASRVLQVPVPDFSGKTLRQVQTEALAPGGRPLFAVSIRRLRPMEWLYRTGNIRNQEQWWFRVHADWC